MTEQVYGQMLRVPAGTARQFPELVDRNKEMLVEILAAKVAEAGLAMDGEVIWLPFKYAKFVKEQHHEHGWQMVEVECEADEADYLFMAAEVVCR